jgi:CRP/FNR family transcriptional regulator
MQKNQKILAETPLFSGLEAAELGQLAHIAVNRHYGKGEIIFSEGDPADGFYVVVDGRVKIFKVSSDGKEQILHIFGNRHPFGEVPVFAGQRFPAMAQAIAASHILFLPRHAFVKLISENPSLALNMLAVLSRRLREFTVQIENLSLKEVPGRLASYLIYLSTEQGSAGSVKLKISKGQLASLLGTIPETLSRIFSRMSDQGLIRVKGRTIDLVDNAGLAQIAEHGRVDI